MMQMNLFTKQKDWDIEEKKKTYGYKRGREEE